MERGENRRIRMGRIREGLEELGRDQVGWGGMKRAGEGSGGLRRNEKG